MMDISDVLKKALEEVEKLYSIKDDYSILKTVREDECQKLISSVNSSIGSLLEKQVNQLHQSSDAVC